jgi:hypothetical protein
MSHPEHDRSSRFGELRSLLATQPSPHVWDALCDLLDRTPHDELLHLAIPYAEDHLNNRWPDHLRACPTRWLHPLQHQQPHPPLTLIRTLEDRHSNNALLHALAQHSPTLHLTHLLARGRINHNGAASLATWPALHTSTKYLDLARNNLNGPGTDALIAAMAEQPCSLTSLRLDQCSLPPHTLCTISTSSHITHALTSLRLDRNHFNDDAALAMLHLSPKRKNTPLTSLGLGGHNPQRPDAPSILPHTLATLADAGLFTTLDHLILNTQISSTHAAALRDTRAPHLQHLDLTGCQLTPQALQLLLDGIAHDAPQLTLSVNALTGAALYILANHPTPRTHLDLSHEALDAESLRALLHAPWSHELRSLILTHTQLDQRAARTLFEADHLQLHTLDLGHNHLHDDGLYWLSRSPACAQLHTLRLPSCRITARGQAMLCSGLWRDSLTELDLSYNPLDLTTLCDATLPSLRSLILEGANPSAADLRRIAQATWLPHLHTLILDPLPAPELLAILLQSPTLSPTLRHQLTQPPSAPKRPLLSP